MWKDRSESCVPLKDMKESHPIEIADFSKSRGIDKEPAFAWWITYTLQKSDIIISAINTCIRKTTHKYGIEIPRSVKHAAEMDLKNGNDFWVKAIKKEMNNVGIAFEILDEDKSAPVGWSNESGHLIFDVKMEFTQKSRWVLDGHRYADPVGSSYAGVVSRDSVRIALTYYALNISDVLAADIHNAYLKAPSSQKHYVICGAEFGLENVGKVALIRRSLYEENLLDVTSEIISANACLILDFTLVSLTLMFGCVRPRNPMERPTGIMCSCMLTTLL